MKRFTQTHTHTCPPINYLKANKVSKRARHTQHCVRSPGRVLPPHLQREHNALVSLDGDAGHCEDARHYGGGLHKGNRLTNQHPCRRKRQMEGIARGSRGEDQSGESGEKSGTSKQKQDVQSL